MGVTMTRYMLPITAIIVILVAPSVSAWTPNLIIKSDPTFVYIDHYSTASSNITIEYQNPTDQNYYPAGVYLTTYTDKPWITSTISNMTLTMIPGDVAQTRLEIYADRNYTAGDVGIVYINGTVTDYEGSTCSRASTISVIGNPYCKISAYAPNWVDIYPDAIMTVPLRIENHGNCDTLVNVSLVVPQGFEWSVDISCVRLDAPTFQANETPPSRTVNISLLAPKKFYVNQISQITVKLDARSTGVYRMPQNETVNDIFVLTIMVKNRGFYFPGYAFESLIFAVALASYACSRKSKNK